MCLAEQREHAGILVCFRQEDMNKKLSSSYYEFFIFHVLVDNYQIKQDFLFNYHFISSADWIFKLWELRHLCLSVGTTKVIVPKQLCHSAGHAITGDPGFSNSEPKRLCACKAKFLQLGSMPAKGPWISRVLDAHLCYLSLILIQNRWTQRIVLPGTHHSARCMRLKSWYLLQPIANLSFVCFLYVEISYQARFSLYQIKSCSFIYNANGIYKLWEFYRSCPFAGNNQSIHMSVSCWARVFMSFCQCTRWYVWLLTEGAPLTLSCLCKCKKYGLKCNHFHLNES